MTQSNDSQDNSVQQIRSIVNESIPDIYRNILSYLSDFELFYSQFTPTKLSEIIDTVSFTLLNQERVAKLTSSELMFHPMVLQKLLSDNKRPDGFSRVESLTLNSLTHYTRDMDNVITTEPLTKLLSWFQPNSSLKHLKLYRLNSLEELPQLNQFSNLETLILSLCVKVSEKSLKENASTLNRLTSLHLNWCPVTDSLFDEFQQDSPLEELYLSYCSKIGEWGFLSKFTNLKRLNLSHTQIASLDSIPKQIEELSIDGCSRIDSLESISNFKQLKRVNIMNISFPSTIVDELSKLNQLEHLELECDHLNQSGINLNSLQSVKNLTLHRTKPETRLFSLPPNLVELQLLKSSWQDLTSVDEKRPDSLSTLHLNHCGGFTIDHLGKFVELGCLRIEWCVNIRKEQLSQLNVHRIEFID